MGLRKLRRSLRRLVKRELARHPRAYMWARRGQEVARYLARRPHEPEFAAFSLFRSRTNMFLDVGANMGQSAFSFRIFHPAPILSIEPNRFHEADLRFVKRLLPRFDYKIFGAGEHDHETTLHVPVYKGLPLTGEAALKRETAQETWWVEAQRGDSNPDSVKIESIPIKIHRLDDLRLAPSFIKVDVEGSELSVIRGLTETIKAHHPILLIENSGDDGGESGGVAVLMRELGYEMFNYVPDEHRFEAHTSDPGRYVSQNVFYIPAEG